jgi:hypothetical protein
MSEYLVPACSWDDEDGKKDVCWQSFQVESKNVRRKNMKKVGEN